jgi:hypothetical protein
MRHVGFWLIGGLMVLTRAVQADEAPRGYLPSGIATASGPFEGRPLLLVGASDRRPLPADFLKEVDALRTLLSELWNLPSPPDPKDLQELSVEIQMTLKPDGTLAGPPRVLTRGDGPLFEAARDNAVSAIYRAQPFNMLRREHYKLWKEIDVTFDPHQMPSR